MSAATTVYLVSAGLYGGFQVTVRGLVYPQMALVPAAGWVAYERAHQQRISRVVGPLFALGAVAAVWLPFSRVVPGVVAIALYGGLLGVTAFGAVPQHRSLSVGFDPAAHRRLLRWDSVRLLLAAGQVALGVVLLR